MPADDDARRRLTRMPPQGAIVAVLALAGLASSFMFTLVVPIQTRLPDLLHANRDDTAWVVTATLLAAPPPSTTRRCRTVTSGARAPPGFTRRHTAVTHARRAVS
jgi:hypothetical protein